MTIETATRTKVAAIPSDAQVMGTDAESMPLTVKGIASRVVLDQREMTATKVYRKHFLVWLLYWLSFQAPFPYRANRAALKAAQYRRRIAGLITRFFLGRDVVAPTIEVRPEGDGYAFVTEYVNGTSPRDKKQARAFLGRVTEAFIKSGLPTWQVTPNNPRAVGNLIETEDGDYRIIDLESNVVTPMMPLSGIWGAAREAHLPAFDDIDVPRLQSFVCKHRTELELALGIKDFRALQRAIHRYAWYERQWHENEPRLWGRLARFAARAIDIPAHVRGLRARSRGGQQMAEGFIRRGIDEWEREERLTGEQASELRGALGKPEMRSVLVNLGAHMAIGIPLRFPLGSVTRLAWTLSLRVRTEWRIIRGDSAKRSLRGVHSLPVALVAAMPGVGGFAYLMSKPLRGQRALAIIPFDRTLRKLPFGMYRRLHLASLMTWLASPSQAGERDAKPGRNRLRPARLVENARLGIASLRPYRRLVAGVAAFNFAALLGGGAYLAATGSTGAFAEMGPITTLKVAEVTAAAALGLLAYRRFWRQPDAERSPLAGGSFFWLIAGAGLGWLALDDYLQIHEKVGSALPGSVPLLNHADDAIVLGYGILGLAMITLFFREIVSSRPVFTLLVAGASLGVLMMAVDFFVPETFFLAGLEDPLHVTAVGSLLAAFAVKYRQVSAEASEAEGERPALPHPKQPAPELAHTTQKRQSVPM